MAMGLNRFGLARGRWCSRARVGAKFSFSPAGRGNRQETASSTAANNKDLCSRTAMLACVWKLGVSRKGRHQQQQATIWARRRSIERHCAWCLTPTGNAGCQYGQPVYNLKVEPQQPTHSMPRSAKPTHCDVAKHSHAMATSLLSGHATRDAVASPLQDFRFFARRGMMAWGVQSRQAGPNSPQGVPRSM